MTEKELADLAIRQQVLLEQLKAHSGAELGQYKDKLDKAISEVLVGLKVEGLNELTAKQLKGLLGDLKKAQQPVYQEYETKTFSTLKDLADHVQKKEGGLLRRLGMPYGVKFADANEDPWDACAARPIQATGQYLEPFVKSWSEKTLAGVNQAVVKAWGSGATIQDTVRAIRGTKRLNYQDGLLEVSRRHAEAIVRTAIQHTAQAARSSVWESNSDILEGWQFLATLDSRTTTQCRSLDGQVFPINSGPQPPVHVNCRSTSVPKLDSKFDFLEEGATRSSKDGYVDAKKTYYSWLKDQPEAFQVHVLGASRAKLFRAGGLSPEEFARLNLGRNFKPLTLEQMKKLDPEAFARAGLAPAPAAKPEPRKFLQLIPEDVPGVSSDVVDRIAEVFKDHEELKYGSGPEWEALYSYKGAGYRSINGALRGTDGYKMGEVAARIKSLDRIMATRSAPVDLVVWRGFDAAQFDFEAMQDFGFMDKGFLSTSLDPDTARAFTMASDGKPAIFKILIPKGTPSVYMETTLGNAQGSSEFELLLNRGTKLRFTGNTYKDPLSKTPIYELELDTPTG